MTDFNTQTQEFASALQEEALRNAQRIQSWFEAFGLSPADPPLGVTPKDAVWQRGKIQLYRYRPQAKRLYSVPMVIVPWVGISRTYILDLLPGNSFIESLVKHGHDVYLLDWGEIAEEDKDLGFEEIVFKVIPRAIEKAKEVSEAEEVTLNGICLGGTATAIYLALNPDAPVRNAVNIVSPIDFDHGGLFKSWLDERYFPVDLIVERYGGIPTSLMNTGFKMLRPTGDTAALTALWLNMDRKEYTTTFKALNRWANDFIGMPGRFFSQLAKELYFKNKLINGEFVLQGHRVDLGKIRQPLLVVAAKQDYIVPPLSAKALADCVSSKDKEYVELPGGHISVFSGRQADKFLWPKIDEWLSQRS
ncbi:MAG: alpha/beta fold hydrolase [Chloroflexi bacterium]|nr:alpha/beta fold hydrolase [Chloroflexota bacterium]